jgi:hypothetical protein
MQIVISGTNLKERIIIPDPHLEELHQNQQGVPKP